MKNESLLKLSIKNTRGMYRQIRRRLYGFGLNSCVIVLFMMMCFISSVEAGNEGAESQIIISVPQMVLNTKDKTNVTIVILTAINGRLIDHNVTMRIYNKDLEVIRIYSYSTSSEGNLTKKASGLYAAEFHSTTGTYYIMVNASYKNEKVESYGVAMTSFTIWSDFSKVVNDLEIRVRRSEQKISDLETRINTNEEKFIQADSRIGDLKNMVNNIQNNVRSISTTVLNVLPQFKYLHDFFYIVILLSGIALAVGLCSLILVIKRKRELEEVFAAMTEDVVTE